METTISFENALGSCVIREASVDDLPEVLEVESTGYPFPWSEAVFLDCFKPHYTFLVLTLNNQVIAYAVISDVVGEAHLLNICVHSDFNRHGLGTRLLHSVIKTAITQKCDSILLEVRKSNIAAKLMYEKFGFTMIGIRKNYYPAENGREDALMYQLDLSLLDTSVDAQA